MEHSADSNVAYFVTVLISVLAILIFSAPLSKRLHLPHSFVLIAIGFFGSELLVAQGGDTGIRWTNFHALTFYVFLPTLIFDAALRMDISKFISNLVPILMLAVPLLFVSTLIGAAIIYFMIGSPQGFPWIAALLAGAVIAPTDPVAVAAVAQRCPLPSRIKILVEGESLLNDATSLTLFVIILAVAVALAKGATVGIPYSDAIFNFLLTFFGGGAIGTVIAIPGCILIRKLRDTNIQGVVTLLCAYGSYLFAEHEMVGFSGIMAVLTCGIMMGAFIRRGDEEEASHSLNRIWSFLAHISESMLFLIAGVTITFSLFTEQWLAMLIGVAAALVSRAVVVYGGFPLFNLTTYRSDPIGLEEQHLIALGGVRGAFTMALALSLPLTLDYWFTVQAIAYGVVLFTLLVQTSALEVLAGKIRR